MRRLIIVCGLAVAACGGSGGNGSLSSTPTPAPTPAPTPTPSPTPTPTPTPTPAPTPTYASFPLTAATTFQTAFATTAQTGNPLDPTLTDAVVVDQSAASTLQLASEPLDGGTLRAIWTAFDSSPGVYSTDQETSTTVTWSNAIVLPTAADREISRFNNMNLNTITVLNTVIAGRTVADAAYRFTYVNYAHWVRAMGSRKRNDLLVYGFPSLVTDIPATGTHSYAGIYRGYDLSVLGATREETTLTGSATLTSDFAARSVTVTFAAPLRTGTGTTAIVTLTGTGNYVVGTNRMTGTISGGGLSGRFTGNFYGPRGAEIGLAIAVQGTTTGTAVTHRFVTAALGK